MFFLSEEASFPVVENYIRNQLISQIYADVDFYLAMGDLYTLNIRIGGVDMFDGEAVRITQKKFFGDDSDLKSVWAFNIIIKKGYIINSDVISSFFEYACEFSQYLAKRDHAKDISEWQECEKRMAKC